MPVWPTSLPQSPLQDSYRETAADNTIRTTMEQGPAKLRRRATSAVSKLAIGFILSPAQMNTLQSFYTSGTSGGIIPFTFPHPRTGNSVSCRMTAPPSIAAIGGYFKVALEMEVLP